MGSESGDDEERALLSPTRGDRYYPEPLDDHKKYRDGLATFLMVIVCFVLLIFIAFEMSAGNHPVSKTPARLHIAPGMTSQEEMELARIHLDPREEVVGEVPFYFQFPSNRGKVGPGLSRGVLVVLHGCNHDPADWFSLPQEKLIVKEALKRSFAVVSVGSHDRTGVRCWDTTFPPKHNIDAKRVSVSLQYFLSRYQLDELPRFAVGASSGGSFATVLARAMHFDALNVIVSPGVQRALWRSSIVAVRMPPPIVFTYMLDDKHFASQDVVEQNARSLVLSGCKSRTFSVDPRPLQETFLSDTIEGITPEMSRAFHKVALQPDLGFTNVDGFIKKDPVTSKMLGTILNILQTPNKDGSISHDGQAWSQADDNTRRVRDASIQEQLNVLYGVHEITFEHFIEAFDWMIRHAARSEYTPSHISNGHRNNPVSLYNYHHSDATVAGDTPVPQEI